ncbi:hypothetical protein KEM60_00190 [Austwickia sp. TVS 96-490-7B]|uniref:hypothetical protein n=1 Tax=Austwickia sp. TVS 96-490-7B TaxID=2830843 RepID=UPI001C55FD1F|nr:hypothetical protein [Austwickia sp. TVS 96-490-7B]MBW3084007.1 hypothetical protein [Austwickia sp. TVS 96-490-7B]
MTTFGLSPLLRSASAAIGSPVTGDLRWLYAGPRDLAALTESDRDLIAVVTGEHLPEHVEGLGVRVSFFTLQLALDRLTGPLYDGRDVSISYMEDIYSAYDADCPAGNPFSGDLLDLALAYLTGRDLARQDDQARGGSTGSLVA